MLTPIRDSALQDVLPYSLSTPITIISKQDKVWTASALLRFFLESFTDQLVVMDNRQPSGLVGGYDIICGILEEPSFDFFENKTVDRIMHKQCDLVTSTTKITELLQKWRKSRRAFSVIHKDSNFSAISIRILLGVYPFLDTALTIQDIPKKKLITYTKEQSVRDVLNIMLQNKTRRLVLEGTQSYISDRSIIEHLSTNLNYLYNIEDFLDMDSSIFAPRDIMQISENTTIQELCRGLYTMEHPYVSNGDQVFSPFDIISILERDDVYAQKLVVCLGDQTEHN